MTGNTWVLRNLLIPAAIAATYRAHLHLIVIDDHPDGGTVRSPSGRRGLNFNFFSVGELMCHVCVKLPRHSVLLWKCIAWWRRDSRQKKAVGFPFHYDAISSIKNVGVCIVEFHCT